MAAEKITTDDTNQKNVEIDNINQEKPVEKEDKKEEKVIHVPIMLADEASDEDEEGEEERIGGLFTFERIETIYSGALILDPEEIWEHFDDEIPDTDDILTPELILTIEHVFLHMIAEMGLPDDLYMYDEYDFE